MGLIYANRELCIKRVRDRGGNGGKRKRERVRDGGKLGESAYDNDLEISRQLLNHWTRTHTHKRRNKHLCCIITVQKTLAKPLTNTAG